MYVGEVIIWHYDLHHNIIYDDFDIYTCNYKLEYIATYDYQVILFKDDKIKNYSLSDRSCRFFMVINHKIMYDIMDITFIETIKETDQIDLIVIKDSKLIEIVENIKIDRYQQKYVIHLNH